MVQHRNGGDNRHNNQREPASGYRPERHQRFAFDPRDPYTLLLIRAQAGDMDCLGKAWEGLTPFMTKRLLSSGLAKAQDVPDILHQAFLNAQKNIESFDYRKGTAAAWCLAIANYRALDVWRHQVRNPTLNLEGFDKAADPSQKLEIAEETSRFQRILEEELATLKPMERQAFEARVFAKRRYADIARELEVPVGTVATWVYRVTRRVRRRESEGR